MVDGHAGDGFRATRPVKELPHAKGQAHFAVECLPKPDVVSTRERLVKTLLSTANCSIGTPLHSIWMHQLS